MASRTCSPRCGLMQNQDMKQPTCDTRRDKAQLWFDVESRYETTFRIDAFIGFGLWFDVESRYETTGCH